MPTGSSKENSSSVLTRIQGDFKLLCLGGRFYFPRQPRGRIILQGGIKYGGRGEEVRRRGARAAGHGPGSWAGGRGGGAAARGAWAERAQGGAADLAVDDPARPAQERP